MRYQGKLVQWDDAKGFGFVLPNAGGRKVFVHINEFRALKPGQRPVMGELLTFEVGLDQQKRNCAVDVQPVQSMRERQRAHVRRDEAEARATGSTVSLVLGVLWAALVVGYALWARLPWHALALWIGINVVTYIVYAADKSAAEAGRWRTSESRLHLFALAGGWPAAALAQRSLRHKSRKAEFRLVYWLTVIVNIVVMLWLVRRGAWIQWFGPTTPSA